MNLSKTIYVILLVLLTSGTTMAQYWEKIYGGVGRVVGYEMVETYDGGFAICAAQGDQQGQILIIKTDVNGIVLWSKTIGYTWDGYLPLSMDVTNDGGFIIAGSNLKDDPMVASMVLKLDKCGETEWCREFGAYNDYDRAVEVKQHPDGSYMVLALYIGVDLLLDEIITLYKLDSNGLVIWQANLSHYWSPAANDLLITKDGGILVTGSAGVNNPGNGMMWWRTILTKVDSSGQEEWHRALGVDQWISSRGACSRETPDGGYLTVSSKRDTTNSSLYWTYLFKTDSLGNYEWSRLIGDSLNEVHEAISIEAYSDSISLVLSDAADTSAPYFKDKLIFMCDHSGAVIDSARFADTLYSWSRSLRLTREQKILVCGTAWPGNSDYKIHALKLKEDLSLDSAYSAVNTYDSLCPQAIVTSSFHISCDTLVGIDPEKADLAVRVFPQPISSEAIFELANGSFSGGELRLFDICGYEVRSYRDISGKRIRVNRNGLAAGIYLYDLLLSDGFRSRGKFIIQ